MAALNFDMHSEAVEHLQCIIGLSKLGGLWQAGSTPCMHAAAAVYTLFMVYHEPVLMT